jgi:ATP-dependent DNA helicase RecG
MMNLTDNISTLRGISDKRTELYKKLGIYTVGGLLTHYPRGYVDYNQPIMIDSVLDQEYAVIRARVTKKLAPIFGRIPVYKLVLTDDSGSITCTFFNCDYTYCRLTIGKEYIFYGKINSNLVTTEIINPVFIFSDSQGKMSAKYRLTKGLSHPIVSGNIKTAIDTFADYEFDDLPDEMLSRFSLMKTGEAVRMIHFPRDSEESERAKRSLVFKELLTLQLGLSMIRSRNRKLTGASMEERDIEALYKTLTFTPTGAQIRAVETCISDMCKAVPMNRLLQGDVGSGKTMVAAALAYFAYLNGYQTALMVPTEILARQHYYVLSKMLAPLGAEVALIVSGMTAPLKKRSISAAESGEASVVVGTHALIQKGVSFHNLGLVVTDEQHRFGVGQRSQLIGKGVNPHTLVMSATPIPRTLGLIIYGDLDISILNEKPEGRLPIKTYGVDSSYRERVYKFIAEKVADGKQAYIVCPLIEESAGRDAHGLAPESVIKQAAVKYYETVQKWFSGITCGLLHGRMKQTEKDKVMNSFKLGEVRILVATTVIEVGVDVTNAVVMLIENAEQFGLSQLHQLRGRVGRGKGEESQSYCVLVSDSKSSYTKARIDTMVATGDGFEIAGKDLELRGPGDFFGSKQHGLPMLKVSDLAADSQILEETQALAKSIIKEDPGLSHNPKLRALVADLFKESNEYGYN